jgi:hypothetical protein
MQGRIIPGGMEAIEALSIIHGEQGFLVINTGKHYEVGDIVTETATVDDFKRDTGYIWIKRPLRIVGISNPQEYWRQSDRFCELVRTAGPEKRSRFPHPNLYRVIVPD